jgi:hypothetical protein
VCCRTGKGWREYACSSILWQFPHGPRRARQHLKQPLVRSRKHLGSSSRNGGSGLQLQFAPRAALSRAGLTSPVGTPTRGFRRTAATRLPRQGWSQALSNHRPRPQHTRLLRIAEDDQSAGGLKKASALINSYFLTGKPAAPAPAACVLTA